MSRIPTPASRPLFTIHGFAARSLATLCLATLCLATLGASVAWGEAPWPQWRGRGDGHWEGRLPSEWSGQNVAWRVALPGAGQSSPVVADNKIFLTSAEENGARRIVFCLDGSSGELLWQQVAWEGAPEKTHQMNMWASATCATDGERVVAFFGHAGLHCYSVDGKPLWRRTDLGEFANPWGTAASPVMHDGLVIQNCDAEDNASLLAVDKTTGKSVWQTPREKLRGWSTPILVEAAGRRELVLNGEKGVDGYDLLSGKHLWFCKGDTGRGSPTVTPAGDFLVAVNGRPGDMIAVRPGGDGEVNRTHEVWRTERRGGRDLPSPIALGSHLIVVNLRPGIATLYDGATGKSLDTRRLKGNFSASPIASGGRAYFPNEEGAVFVLGVENDKLQLIAENRIDTITESEIVRASLTPLGENLLLRSTTHLYCIRP